jgi:hypothetical protein
VNFAVITSVYADFRMVPGTGIEPARVMHPADFESAASASNILIRNEFVDYRCESV